MSKWYRVAAPNFPNQKISNINSTPTFDVFYISTGFYLHVLIPNRSVPVFSIAVLVQYRLTPILSQHLIFKKKD
ncbi:hypothetical protein HanIR_Chr15g0772821 [Helianthus annuus]|nr:hypothetical protein HanIR_Chr15g0772821 [Helianthus annuus]